MFRLVRSLAAAIPTARTHRIEGAGHAAAFDATTNFVQLIADTISSGETDLSAFMRETSPSRRRSQSTHRPSYPDVVGRGGNSLHAPRLLVR